MRSAIFKAAAWSCAAVCTWTLTAADSRFTQIDYPGASSSQAWGINSKGDIIGYYTGADNNTHGFLLNAGHYSSIDYPGAAVTQVNAINPQGDMVGLFSVTSTSPSRGFRLSADGVFTPYDFPGATTTSLAGINARGEIAGQYTLSDGARHTFLLVNGTITKIDYPGASQTGPLGISPLGEVVGAYVVNGVAHGYVYSTGSGFTTIDHPNSTYTNATGRSASGDVIGRYLDASGVSHGYILSNGQFTSVDFAGASFTGLGGLDAAGNIVGRATVNGVNHGFLFATARPAQRYAVTDLGPVGALPGQPEFITANRLVAGSVTTQSGLLHAVVWSGSGMTDLGGDGLNSMAFGINENGLTVGQAETSTKDPGGEDFCGSQALGFPSSGATCAAFAAWNGNITALPTLGGANAFARGVNSRGQIVGAAENLTLDPACSSPQKYQFKPVLWQGEDVLELPTAAGDRNGIAHNINGNGDIVGGSGNCAAYDVHNLQPFQPQHALLWEAGRVIDLGNLGGKGLIMGHYAYNLNNHMEVTGYSDVKGDQAFHAFRWTRVGGMEDLGTLPGDGHSVGLGINDQGVITGISIAPDFSALHPFVWSGGKMMDLNQLIPANAFLYLLTACSINARGEITGFAADSNGNLHGYLAVPVAPEVEAGLVLGVSSSKPSPAAQSVTRSIAERLSSRHRGL